MKKFVALASVFILTLTIAGCGGSQQAPAPAPSEPAAAAPDAPAEAAPPEAAPEQVQPDDHLASLGLKNLNLAELSDEDKKYKINLGYYDCDHMTAACVGEAAGIYEALGLDVTILGNGKVPEAVSAGNMDAGYIRTASIMAAVPKGAPIHVAANNHTGGSYYLVMSNDIESPSDLPGKKMGIGTNAGGTSPNWVGFATQLGIPRDSEAYEAFDMSDKDKYFALKAGKLDGYICCDPWGSMAEFEGTGKIIATSFYMTEDQILVGEQGSCCAFALSDAFAKEHPELAKRLLLAHTKSIEYMYTHPYKSAAVFAEYYNVPEEVGLMTIYKKLVNEGRTITWEIDEGNLQTMIDWFNDSQVAWDFGAIEDCLDVSLLSQCGASDFKTFINEKVDPVFPTDMTYEQFLTKAKEIDNI